jgi:hypothetical protein
MKTNHGKTFFVLCLYSIQIPSENNDAMRR